MLMPSWLLVRCSQYHWAIETPWQWIVALLVDGVLAGTRWLTACSQSMCTRHRVLLFYGILEVGKPILAELLRQWSNKPSHYIVIIMTSGTTLNIIRLHNMSTIYSIYCPAIWDPIWQQTINYMYLISLSNMSHDSHPYLWHIWWWPHPPAGVASSSVVLQQPSSKKRRGSISHSSPPWPQPAYDQCGRNLRYSPS